MYMKKMPFPMKAGAKKSMPKEKDMALELEIEEEEEGKEGEEEGEEEESMDLKSMMQEGEEAPEMGPLAEASDEELMAEMKKRGLMPAESAVPEAKASKPPMMK